MSWTAAARAVRPYVVRIETQDGYGSGFLFAYNSARSILAIATAEHVIQKADDWQQAIKIHHEETGLSAPLLQNDRVIYRDSNRDSAVLILPVTPDRKFPKTVLPIFENTNYAAQGTPVGWLGYPAIAQNSLCFFQGHTSAFDGPGDYYLIDGVSINGLSGGPIFREDNKHGAQLIGFVSAYFPNWSTGQSLPGLLKAYDLTAAHFMIERMRGFDDARKQREEADAAAAAAVAETAPPANAGTTSLVPGATPPSPAAAPERNDKP